MPSACRFMLPLALAVYPLLGGLAAVRAAAPIPTVEFLQEHCYDCHAGEGAEAGLDLQQLPPDLTTADATSRWTRIYDRVRSGEMPPADYNSVEQDQAELFLTSTERWIATTLHEQHRAVGRVPARRLTNHQLELTLQDLLGIDLPLQSHMPKPARTGHFSTLAEYQSMSHYDLEQHLAIVDLALDEAFRRALSRDDYWLRELTAKQISRTHARTREPEYIDGAAVVWSSGLAFYGRVPATTAKVDGWYRFRFEVSSLNKPNEHGVWCTVRSGACVSSSPLMSWVASFEAEETPKEVTVEAWLPAGHMLEIRPGDRTLKQAKFAGGQAANGEGGKQNVPGIKMGGMVVERIHRHADDPQVRKTLFGDLVVKPGKPGKTNSAGVVRLPTSDHAEVLQIASPLLLEFAQRAFRRAVNAEDLLLYEQIFETTYAKSDFVAALRASYRAILCSARFLYLQELPGRLDDYAIANRLSYFLWSSMPDSTLMELAAAGELQNPQILRQQVRRMLATPRGQDFIVNFAREWLELGDIGFTEPDPRMYKTFDPIVQDSMLRETHAFLQELLEQDLDVRSLVDSDFTFLDSRLARFYNIPDVQHDHLRRIELLPQYHRGGLMAQGAVLKVTANGTNTSPVLRGVWIANRLLGNTIPPPPASVPAIEPDIRGATTIREQLAQHRDHAECASCHRKIDPPGFALENFDPAGGWREFYPRQGRSKKGPKVDPSYVTAEGEPFDDFEAFKRITSRDPIPVARNLARQFLTYGSGAPVSFADRAAVEGIVQDASQHDYGMRSILEAVVCSEPFLTK